jgi:hypothetical protein
MLANHTLSIGMHSRLCSRLVHLLFLCAAYIVVFCDVLEGAMQSMNALQLCLICCCPSAGPTPWAACWVLRRHTPQATMSTHHARVGAPNNGLRKKCLRPFRLPLRHPGPAWLDPAQRPQEAAQPALCRPSGGTAHISHLTLLQFPRPLPPPLRLRMLSCTP